MGGCIPASQVVIVPSRMPRFCLFCPYSRLHGDSLEAYMHSLNLRCLSTQKIREGLRHIGNTVDGSLIHDSLSLERQAQLVNEGKHRLLARRTMLCVFGMYVLVVKSAPSTSRLSLIFLHSWTNTCYR